MSNIHPIELKRRLRRLSRALNTQTRDINWGGCGVMACIVGEIFELWGIPVEVVTHVSDYSDVSPAEARYGLYRGDAEIDDRMYWWAWDAEGLNRSHLAVRFKLGADTYTLDSAGLLKSDKYFGRNTDGSISHCADYPFGDGMTVAECALISRTPDGWNYMFDRSQIPLIRELAYQHLLN